MQINEKVEMARASGAAGLLTLWGLTLNEWVAVATLLYLAIQIVILFPKAVTTVKSFIKK